MLDLDAIDVDDLCTALEDHSFETSWWLDPESGETRFHSPYCDDETVDDLDDAGLVRIDPIDSRAGYSDMEDFIAVVPDTRAADTLARAIQGRGAFRRFKDALFDFPELRDHWFAFHDARMRRRAIEWLAAQGLIDDAQAAAATAKYPDPRPPDPAREIVDSVVADLERLYRNRLVGIYVFGSRARGDDVEGSDLDLLVVLDRVESPWDEHRRMDEVLWRHTLESGVTIAALPVSIEQFDHPRDPLLLNIKREAIPAA